MNRASVTTNGDKWLRVSRNTDVSFVIATSLTFAAQTLPLQISFPHPWLRLLSPLSCPH